MTLTWHITSDIGGIDANYSLQSAEMSFFIITYPSQKRLFYLFLFKFIALVFKALFLHPSIEQESYSFYLIFFNETIVCKQ
jgi:hypothetical protein